jgi:hypothetical protein
MQLRSIPGLAFAGAAMFTALFAESSFPILSADALDLELELHAETAIKPTKMIAMLVTT